MLTHQKSFFRCFFFFFNFSIQSQLVEKPGLANAAVQDEIDCARTSIMINNESNDAELDSSPLAREKLPSWT